jgi:uncharacterized repeat protein (TIGR04138 family)
MKGRGRRKTSQGCGRRRPEIKQYGEPDASATGGSGVRRMRHAALAEIVLRDPRYAYEAYEFMFAALQNTQRMVGKIPPEAPGEEMGQYHVSGRQLVEGACDLALREFGMMARAVLRQWGIQSTADFGEIVFNLIEAKLMSKNADDTRADFADVLDLDRALVQGFEIKIEEGE